ncbi:TIGR04086 family membrane protein [Effusibacillus pohliae]|uniref:TIGR04086 family membrane protein n=1 Tax=Effusibacillus pohliae TaxID=232270 RepID=UPI00037E8BF6|nr:TIGR04086 family membrane protein [Effusibacillus pohliae]
MKGKSFSDMAPQLGGAPVLHGLIYAYAVAFGAILLATALITWTAVPESKLPVITYAINLAAVVIGSFVSARRSGEKGWYYGGLTGLFYSVSITLLGLIVVAASFTLHNVIQIVLLSAIGGLGGIIGVNTRSRR